jgi:hypothetical protein
MPRHQLFEAPKWHRKLPTLTRSKPQMLPG